ncbi:MAG TPA: pilus assembly protein PilM [Chitinivibrionales bacterium]|nr:pilus assembly protein PilM [Chitinivibrionales bacterium]
MADRGDCVSGIDLTKENISIAQYSASENTVVNASIIISPLDEADPSDDIITSLRAKFKKVAAQMKCEGQHAAVAVPAQYAVVKKFTLDADENDVRGALEWELGQHLIGGLGEYSFDFEPMAREGDTEQYLAVAYRSSSVQKLVSLVKAGKLSPAVVDIDIFALIDVFEANYADAMSAPAVIIHGNGESTRLVLTKNGAFADFDVMEPARHASSPDAYGSQMLETMAQSFASVHGRPPIYLTGPIFADPDFTESVCSRMGVARVLDPFRAIRSTVDIPKSDLRKCIPYLTVAVGLALRAAAEGAA